MGYLEWHANRIYWPGQSDFRPKLPYTPVVQDLYVEATQDDAARWIVTGKPYA